LNKSLFFKQISTSELGIGEALQVDCSPFRQGLSVLIVPAGIARESRHTALVVFHLLLSSS